MKKLVRWLAKTLRRHGLVPPVRTSEIAEHIKAFNAPRIYVNNQLL